MSNKILWSNNMTKDHITSLTEDEKFNALVDRGYDKDALELSDLNKILEDDDFMGHDDLEKIEDELVPMINKQARDGIIFIDGKAIFADELLYAEGDLVIEEDEDGLLINGKPVYAIPEELDKLDAFIYGAMPAAWEFETEDGAEEDMAIATLEDEVRDPNFVNDFIDEEKIAEFCPRVKMIIEEAVEAPIKEEIVDEAKTDDKKGLAKELKEIKALADEYGFKYFTSMPFSNFDDDPITIEYQYPNFARVVKAFFKEMGVLTAEEVKDPDEMDVQWDEGINQHDWDTIIKTCEMLKDHNSVQIEKVYKNGYATLDDDEILADRKRQDDLMAELEGDINDDYDESLNEAKEKSLKEIVREIKVNGPAFRGDEYPAFDELAINEENFDDSLRFKEYDIDVDEDDNVVINWTSQEFGDWESLEEEIIRCLKANMAEYGIPSLKLIFKGDSRDGGHEFEDEFELSNIEEGLVKEDTATDVELDEFPWGPLNK